MPGASLRRFTFGTVSFPRQLRGEFSRFLRHLARWTTDSDTPRAAAAPRTERWAVLADDVVFLPSNQAPVVGRDGVVNWFAGVVSQAPNHGIAVRYRDVTKSKASWPSSVAGSTWHLLLAAVVHR